MEIRLQIDDEIINELKTETDTRSTAQITNDALALFKWAVSEVKQGRVLVSQTESGTEEREIVMPILEKTKRKYRLHTA
jgi:hypothetical protein